VAGCKLKKFHHTVYDAESILLVPSFMGRRQRAVGVGECFLIVTVRWAAPMLQTLNATGHNS